jgi:hypothetical protein
METPVSGGGAPAARLAHDPLREVTDQWLDWCRQAGAWSYGNFTAAAFFYDPRQMRRAWLAELGRSTDRYLRSAPFLEWMRISLAGVARSRQAFSANRLK